jgi:photosystem II stability/assembly factor-like uncharacterized protein
MKKKSVFPVILFAAIVLTLISCNHNLTGFDPSEYSYGIWQLQRDSQNDGYYWHLFFVDKDNGWAIGDSGKIIHTTNGGVNWEYYQNRINGSINSIHFENKNKGWATSGRKILNSTNGGENWQVQFYDSDTTQSYQPKTYYSIIFVDEFTGWTVNNYGEIWGTKDGGKSWKKQISWELGGAALLFFINKNIGFALEARNELFKTLNGGENWANHKIEGIRWASDLFFIDENTGWIVTQNIASSSMQRGSPIYQTIDGGNSWIFKDSIDDEILSSVTFADNKIGWISGMRGIYQTIDGGNTWKANIDSLDKRWMQKVFAVDKDNVWALNFKGKIFKYIPNYKN